MLVPRYKKKQVPPLNVLTRCKTPHFTKSGKVDQRYKNGAVSYLSAHQWILRKKGKPTTCEHCKKTGFKVREIQWANKDHQYKLIMTHWMRLCIHCHNLWDMQNNRRSRSLEKKPPNLTQVAIPI